MAAKRHMDIKRNITGHTIIIADIAGYFLKRSYVRCQGGLLPNPIKSEIHYKIEIGWLTLTKEEAAHDELTPICS